jgi:hypothetical protein
MDNRIIGPYPDLARKLDTAGTSGVLNPTLYQRLQRRFGSVLVAKAGEAMFGGGFDYSTGARRYTPLSAGEYYRVCCPFCLQRNAVDTRYRLWINHRWGVGLDPLDPCYDPLDRFWWMCCCYNENCMSAPENRQQLRSWIYGGVGRELHREQIKILPGRADTLSLGVVSLPGTCQRVDSLPAEHAACQYLRGRGFDPKTLGEVFDVSFCFESHELPAAANKIIIPIKMGGQLVGWQARPAFDADWKAMSMSKYYNAPGINRRLMLYGMEQARALPFCILVEGVTDVWAIGLGAVALLGKTLSAQQTLLLCNNWKAVVLALDSGAQRNAEEIAGKLNSEPSLAGRIVIVRMPQGLDPASVNNEYFWDLVYGHAQQAGVDLFAL